MSHPVPSPCINVCRMDAATGLCTGCLRTLEEIATWGGLSEREKRAVSREIESRRRQDGQSGTGASS